MKNLNRYKSLVKNSLYVSFNRPYKPNQVTSVSIDKINNGFQVYSTDGYSLFNNRYFESVTDAVKYFKRLELWYRDFKKADRYNLIFKEAV